MKENNQIAIDSKKFAIRIVKLYKYLNDVKKEFVISKQILRSGTSIGANISESVFESLSDDNSKLIGTLVNIINSTKKNNV